ncbi:PREDICTED: GRAM domain-containing protein 1B-like [Amphimedon queenslandica]|uniref:VASt domain-containing protein n=1 Tax=Amphimedon queenslandica TaxID=400682 RepID=A0A1X7UR26_AMPQE|nr:PREDICTED: GRAM domain-containing protein 1B-like [Amphimedon queenslandica]|eukprot:XP_019852961.1 PREDICTED: GRAM domain-containing protein 1B-like [Amphimedon queenslandica]
MAEKPTDFSNRSPTRSSSNSSSVGGGGGRDSLEVNNPVTTAAATGASPKPNSGKRSIFGRSRSTSMKEDSDDAGVNQSGSDKEKEKSKKDKGSWQFFGPPKPKSGTGWLPFSFAMTHREKNNEIHKIFKQLPSSEKLIDDYSCALQRDILIHGRLYVTQNWICFYANIFSWETLLTIPLVTVTSITKERTALVIPNAILITTTVEKYGFSSLIQRDLTYNILFKVWQNSLLDQPIDPLELVKAARKTWGDSTDVGTCEDLWGPNDDSLSSSSSGRFSRHNSMTTHLEIGQVTSAILTEGTRSPRPITRQSSSDSARMRSSSGGQTALAETMATPTVTKPIATPIETRGGDPKDASTPTAPSIPGPAMSVISDNTQTSTETGSTEVAMIQSSHKDSGVRGEDDREGKGAASSEEYEQSTLPDDQGEVSCGCTEHNGRTILNEIYNTDVEHIFQLLFTGSDFFRDLFKARKTTNLEVGEWTTQADNSRIRDITYTLSLNYSFGPKYSPCVEHQVYSKIGQPGVRHVVNTDVVNSNIPYGDTFYVSCTFCMTRVAHNKTRLRVTGNICFKKNCWGVVKNLIERNAGDGLRSYYSHLDTALKEYLVNLPAKRLQKMRRTPRRRHKKSISTTSSNVTVKANQQLPLVAVDEESGSGLKKRRGSMSSRLSLKSFDNKVSEEDTVSSFSGDKSSNKLRVTRTCSRTMLGLAILLSLLMLSNIALYHQLITYQSSSTPSSPSSSFPSSSSSLSQGQPQPTTLSPSSIEEWPTKHEDWIKLVQSLWRQRETDQKAVSQVLREIHNAMQQVELTIQKTRKIIENHLELHNKTQ